MIIWEDFLLSKAEAATRHLAKGGFVCESGNCLQPSLNYKRTKKEQIGWPTHNTVISLCKEHSNGRIPLKIT